MSKKNYFKERIMLLILLFAFMTPFGALAQTIQLTGLVTDAANEPIIGASVVEKGTTNGVITDFDGNFALSVSPKATIIISYVGYATQEVPVNGKTNIRVTLKEDTEMLDEVVVVGYGTMKKSDMTGAISSVDVDDLVKRTTTNPAEALQGKIAGVNIMKAGGNAGAGVQVKIRGVKTFGDNQPLYIIDGFLKAAFAAPQIAAKENATVTCPLVIWMQGEYNYWADTTRGLLPYIPNVVGKDEYKTLMLRLKNDMQNDVVSIYNQHSKPLFITYQVGAQYTRGRTLNIGMAQLEAANETEDIICAGPVYPMTDRGGHLDANGYRWYGEMLAKAYYRTIIGGKPFIPLQPEELSRTSDSKEIKICFRVPVKPLVLDDYTTEKIKDYGFAIYNDGIRQKITDVKVKGDCVYITCEKDLSGAIEVTYAGADEFKGHGNLRDSDDYEAYYTYIDQDEKNSDGTFVFARDKDKNGNYVTLRPNYEPRDKSGNIIYGRPYPLYNFSVAFYYKLDKGVKKYRIHIPEKDKSKLDKVLEINK